VSIIDVAHAAGVSVGTASNVLNKPERVAADTRRRVEQAIAKLNYVPSGPARALRSGQVKTVGAILLDIRNPFYTDVARGIEDRLEEEDFTLIFGSSDGDPKREQRYLQIFESRGVAGLIVAPVCENVALLSQVAQRGTPMVLLEASFPELEASSILVDNVAGGVLAAKHLAEIGCDRLVMFNGSHEIPHCVARLEGARQGWTEAGRSLDTFEERRIPSLNIIGGDRAAQEWLADDPPARTGIFAVNDLAALGVQRALRRVGGYDPSARPLIGFDDIDIISAMAVPLSTIRQPTYEIGRRAADLLLHRRAQDPTEAITVRPELIVRESTRPDPAFRPSPGQY
jgi:LacI family transcriptional regulator